MLKKIAIAAVVVVVAFTAFVAMQPSEFQITRSTTIDAPPSAVFAHVDDLHAWERWSPWATLDPKMKTAYEGPASGTGAIYAWDGNDDVGAGRMTITDSRPHQRIAIELEFMRPFEASNTAEFTFEPEGGGDRTVVTWTMTGHNDFMGKLVSLFVDMDAMIGGAFDEGLAQMKAVVEGAAG